MSGALLVFYAWPVAKGAWYAQQADAVVDRLRDNLPINLPDTLAAIDAYNRAVAAGPTSLRLGRSELLVGAAIELNWAAPDSERGQWLRTAQSDLEAGLAGSPARGIAWQRLAAVRQTLEGPSTRVVGPLLMAIRATPVIPRRWPARLAMILNNWEFFSDSERNRVAEYVVMTWQASSDRRWFTRSLSSGMDEIYLRILLGDLPGAQEELSQWLALDRK